MALRAPVDIRDLLESDVAAMTEVHLAAFPKAAMTRLGPEAVRRYYHWQVCGPHQSTSIGAYVAGNLKGFCVGGRYQGAVSGFVKRNAAFLAGRVLLRPWLLLLPAFRGRLQSGLKALVLRPLPPPQAVSSPISKSFGILAICTHPEVQGAGVGQALMMAAEERARAQGFARMNLSVHPSNSQAIRFYQKQGWVPDAEVPAWGGQMFKELGDDRR